MARAGSSTGCAESLEPRRLLSGEALIHTGPQPVRIAVLPGEPRFLVEAGGSLYFSVDGSQLWKSDGTPDGTTPILDVHPELGWDIRFITPVGNRVFFSGNDGQHGYELWVSDGSPDGTRMVTDLNPGINPADPQWLTAVDDQRVIFTATGLDGRRDPWISDGTPVGTTRVVDLPEANPQARDYFVHNGVVYFLSNPTQTTGGLYRSDLTPGGTVLLRSIVDRIGTQSPISLAGHEWTVLGDRVFFCVRQVQTTLWTTDGSTEGTQPVAVISPSNLDFRSYLTRLGDRLVFVGQDATRGREIWSSDGTPQGTGPILDIRPGPDSALPAALFVGDDPGWWPIRLLGGRVYFAANDGTTGEELWSTDGTVDGTRLVSDLTPGPEGTGVMGMTVAGEVAYYRAGVGAGFTDGTPPGTEAIPTTAAIPRDAYLRVAYGNALFYSSPAALFRLDNLDITAPVMASLNYRYDDPNPSVLMTFSEPIVDGFDTADFVVENRNSGHVLAPGQYEVSRVGDSGERLQLLFSGFARGAPPDGNYRVTIRPGVLEDRHGNASVNASTGEWYVLAGDADRNRSVTIADLATLAGRYNLPGTFSQGDFDYSGLVDIGDLAIVASKYNSTLPWPPARASISWTRAGIALAGGEGAPRKTHDVLAELLR